MSDAWWRDEPLGADDHELLRLVFEAHARACARDSASNVVLVNAGLGSGDYGKAIGAALMTLGDRHGPIAPAQRLLESESPRDAADRMIRLGEKVPGWGQSFVRGQEDPDWLPLRDALARYAPAYVERLDGVTELLHALGKDVYPNPAAYTALVAIYVGLPPDFSPWLLLAGRLPAWNQLLLVHGFGRTVGPIEAR